MSDLIKLDNIAKRNGDIVCATFGDNLKSVQAGKYGWGEVVIAVDNKTIDRIIKDEMVGVLYIASKEEWEKENNK